MHESHVWHRIARRKTPDLTSTTLQGFDSIAMILMRWSSRKPNGRWPVGVPRPCIPIIGTSVPAGSDWLHEIKHDGYRLLVRKDGDAVSIITRGGYDWTERYPLIVAGALRLRASFVIDGEGVVCGENGVADFELLHSRKHDCSCFLRQDRPADRLPRSPRAREIRDSVPRNSRSRRGWSAGSSPGCRHRPAPEPAPRCARAARPPAREPRSGRAQRSADKPQKTAPPHSKCPRRKVHRSQCDRRGENSKWFVACPSRRRGSYKVLGSKLRFGKLNGRSLPIGLMRERTKREHFSIQVCVGRNGSIVPICGLEEHYGPNHDSSANPLKRL